ncbi:MAG: hypothetical protein MK110_05445 [Fuerstiella sp.]|nr:hypothetical protein [Fuerstiella sp.]
MSVEPDIVNLPAEPVYFCPGESSPISQAVHRARLAAYWPGCRICRSRDEWPEPKKTDNSAAKAAQSIRRTHWGIRGVWQNALTRHQAAQLIGVVTGHLLTQCGDEETRLCSSGVEDPKLNSSIDSPMVVTGYDGRASSPDIYAGIVTATLQNGCHVIDTGRATAASIQETCRNQTRPCWGIIVTGAGAIPSVTGFDLFDDCGQGVSIPWQASGIRIQQIRESNTQFENSDSTDRRDVVARLKHSIHSGESDEYPLTADISPVDSTLSSLELPRQATISAARFRRARRSGQCHSIDAESAYRRWLHTWFPKSITARIICSSCDPLVRDRLQWLFSESGRSVDVVVSHSSASAIQQLSQRVRKIHADWGISIAEDDRYMTVVNRDGYVLENEHLSGWLNETVGSVRDHVSTHVPAEEDRIVLLDAGRPNQGAAHEVISDSLALLGCLCQVTRAGTALPGAA